MRLKWIGKGKTSRVEFIGEDHTFLNLLRKELTEDKKVKLAAYTQAHPYMGNPVLTLEADDNESAIKRAAKRLAEMAKEAQVEFSRAFKV